MNDDQLFVDNDNDGHYEFEPPTLSDPSEPEGKVAPTEFEAELIAKDGAKVVLENGEPAVELTPAEEYLNEIKDMQNVLYQMGVDNPGTGAGSYVV
jgi:hypothetical protein